MKKINIEKNEGIAEVLDKIYNEPDKNITLIIPNNSVLLKSQRNFNILKDETEEAGRDITIESVDENILSFAKASGLNCSHPLWNGPISDGRFSDIIAEEKDEESEDAETASSSRKKTSVRKTEKKEPVKIKIVDEDEDEEENEEDEESDSDDKNEVEKFSYVDKDERWKKWAKKDSLSPDIDGYEKKTFDEEKVDEGKKYHKNSSFFKDIIIPKEDEDDGSDAKKVNIKRVVGYTFLVVLIIGGIFFGFPYFFGNVKINLNFVKTQFTYNNSVTADKSVSTINYSNNTIPAQVFVSNKNVTQLFKASGNANVSQKATGIITIYNSYSSAPQALVATTRFVTPDGKIFRLVNGVTVPGATVTNGKIIPSSIDAPIIADKPGDSYNVSNIAKLTIPGFQGTPKYDGFYGSISSSTTNGFIGNRAVPVASDITNAKAKMTDILNSAFQANAQVTYPNDFIILDGSTSTVITKLSVNTSTDENGNFSVFGEAVFTAIGFNKNDLNNLLLSSVQSNNSVSSTFSDLNINYSNIKPDFSNGRISFTVDAKGDTEAAFSKDDFVNSILGKDISTVRSIIGSLPGIANGSISEYPVWLSSIPTNKDKIFINVN